MLGVLGFKKQASELTLPRYLKPALTGGMRGWRTPGPRVRGPLVSNRGCPLQSTEGPLERRYGSSPLIQYQRPPGARVNLLRPSQTSHPPYHWSQTQSDHSDLREASPSPDIVMTF